MNDSATTAIRVGLLLAGCYAGLGLVFAAAFHATGLRRLDPKAHEAGWGFRLIITPGVVALWPVLLALWVKRKRHACDSGQGGFVTGISQRTLRTWHRAAWFALLVIVPAGLILALAQRPPAPKPASIPWPPSSAR